MALEDIYVLDFASEFANDPMHNIFTYERSTSGTSTDLLNAFMEDIFPLVRGLFSSNIHYTTVKAYSLGNLGDLDERVIDLFGTREIDMLPVFNAINYTLKPVGRGVRPGSKRFAGIPEIVQVSGTITDAAYIASMEVLRLALAEAISDDDLAYFDPVVVKRVKYEIPGSSPVRFGYRFPEVELELDARHLRLVSMTTKISHQVSRGS